MADLLTTLGTDFIKNNPQMVKMGMDFIQNNPQFAQIASQLMSDPNLINQLAPDFLKNNSSLIGLTQGILGSKGKDTADKISIAAYAVLFVITLLPFLFVIITEGGINSLNTTTLYNLNGAILTIGVLIAIFSIAIAVAVSYSGLTKFIGNSIVIILSVISVFSIIIVCIEAYIMSQLAAYTCQVIPSEVKAGIQKANAFNIVVFGIMFFTVMIKLGLDVSKRNGVKKEISAAASSAKETK